MREALDFSALWNILETKKEPVHSRNSLEDHTLSFCINGETAQVFCNAPFAYESKFGDLRSSFQISDHIQHQAVPILEVRRTDADALVRIVKLMEGSGFFQVLLK